MRSTAGTGLREDAISRETNDQEVIVGRGAEVFEKVRVYDRCSGNGKNSES